MKNYSKIIIGFVIAVFFGGLSANTAVGQEYNARNEFSLKQGGTNGVLNYDYTANADYTATSSTLTFAPGDNLATSGTASQSSTNFGGLASRANDGNTDGNYNNNSVSHTDFQSQPYWDLDLGASNAAKTLDRINVWNRTDGFGDRTVNFHVFVSNNPFTGITVADSQAQSGVQDNFNASQAGSPTTIDIANRTGRYIRVQLESPGTLLHLAEVEVFEGVPTAAQVSIGGRVAAADGAGIRNVVITLTDSNGATRTARTSSFGYFRFDEVEAGETYVLGVQSKRFTFSQPTRIINVSGAMDDILFTAEQ